LFGEVDENINALHTLTGLKLYSYKCDACLNGFPRAYAINWIEYVIMGCGIIGMQKLKKE
jgi:hypothetical protein